MADHVTGLRAAHDDRTGRATNGAMAAARRKRALEHCEQRELPPEVLACVMAAEDRPEVHACEHGDDMIGAK